MLAGLFNDETDRLVQLYQGKNIDKIGQYIDNTMKPDSVEYISPNCVFFYINRERYRLKPVQRICVE